MPVRRTRRNTNNTNDTNTNTNNTNNPNPTIQELAQIISQQVAVVLPTLVTQLNQAANVNPVQNNGNGGGANPTCTFKHFNSCNPTKFIGTEGATGLLQWFESIESTFIHSDCPENLKVRYATSVFQKRALTWWNGEKRTRGSDAALALTWTEVKQLMTNEFCPRNEMRKLEAEFWDLKQDSGENLAYTTRFHELSLLVPHLVTPLSRAIEKYIGGLPMQIQDTVFGSNPMTLEEAIRLAATLTDNHVKDGTLTRKGSKKVESKSTTNELSKEVKTETSNSSKFNHRKRKANNFAVVTPAAPVNQQAPKSNTKPYVGPNPLCNTCRYHHPTTQPCRICTNCGMYGHLANYCRHGPLGQQGQQVQPMNQQQLAPANPVQANGRVCYECGDPNHLRDRCPRLAGNNQRVARARNHQLVVQDAQPNQDIE
ncbi:hypothetical protein E3N88_17986 [Mikania micrantha]|uniref:CCHC-type domain-containing protein n=1 Tax=Mikania micrantha TaxID=192012 RepID=A0A5N6NUT9_9ASTR|nr:hypothetical protein E3N88_17986 [Mikania micrantha]